MNDLVLEGFVKDFARARGLEGVKQDALFEAFATSAILRKYHQANLTDLHEGFLVGGGGDGGLDAVIIMVNGKPIHAKDDVDFLFEDLRRLEVEFVFVQAKTSSSFNASQIGTFAFGVEQFFKAVWGKDSDFEFNSDVNQLIELAKEIFRQRIRMLEYPKCFLYYVTTGKWTGAREPSSRLTDGKSRLRDLNIFSDIHANPVDAELLKGIYLQLERSVVTDVELSRAAIFPRIDGVDAYIGLLRGDEFIRLVSTDDGELNRELFFDNVRDFQGHNPVNTEIERTLADSSLRRNFPLLNNGVTIVARELRRQSDTFTISDYQIVNGCQTTHILYQNKNKVNEDMFIPVKLVATSERELISEVIKATNSQTEVRREAFESLTQFHKDLEALYVTLESDRPFSERVFYERRSKQYARDDISPRNIVTLTGQIKSFIGMFLNEPHSHPGYYGALLRSYEGRLFIDDHEPAPYYASGVALIALDKWLSSHASWRLLRDYKYHLLMILKVLIGGRDQPRLTSKAISDFSLQIVSVLRDGNKGVDMCNQAEEILLATLGNFGTPRGGGNPPHRLRLFTERLIQNLSVTAADSGTLGHSDDVSVGAFEGGKIKWFDEWRNFGFIARDVGGDLFVHGSHIRQVPWHLRNLGKRVHFRVVRDPKSSDRIMASDVRLENA